MYDLTPALELVDTLTSQIRRRTLTIELLEHALDGAGAATAAHGDVELVVVFGHGVECVWYVDR